MDTASFIQAAGRDPFDKADDILLARPGEVAALGQAFQLAADALTTSGSLSGIAGELADAGAVFDGSTPTDLMAEVSAVRESLNAGPAQLSAIAGPLQQLAIEISSTQAEVEVLLLGMVEECSLVVAAYEFAQTNIFNGGADWGPTYLAKGVAVVNASYDAVCALVDAYDATAAGLLVSLQGAQYLIPPDVDAAVADTSGPLGVPVCPVLPTGGPEEVQAWWAAQSPEQQALLIQQHPMSLVSLIGLPPAVYDMINRRELAYDHIEVAPSVAADIAILHEHGLHPSITSVEELLALPDAQLHPILHASPEATAAASRLMATIGVLTPIIGTQKSIADEPDGQQRYLLEYDSDAYGGDGAAVIAIGEIDSAENVAIVVQGATHDLSTIAGQTTAAESILDQMNDHADDNAVIVYAGYDNPDISQAASSGRAEDGGQLLADDISTYVTMHEDPDDLHLTVIGHSYGTVTTSYALQAGAADHVDAVVLYGSPGVDVDHVSELGMPADRVFVAMDPDDVLWGLDKLITSLELDHIGLDILGPDPTNESFGATVLETGGVGGHTDYFNHSDGKPNDTLYSAGVIAAGQYELALD